MTSTITINDIPLVVEYEIEEGVCTIEYVRANGDVYELLERKVTDEIEQKLILINK